MTDQYRDAFKQHEASEIKRAAKILFDSARTKNRDGEPVFESYEILEMLDAADTLNRIAFTMGGKDE